MCYNYQTVMIKRYMRMRKFIGDKAFYKKVFFIAIPIIVQNAITNFVSLLDNLMVGQMGTDQMNGVAIVNQIMFVFYLCSFGAVSGAGIFTAQYYGKGDDEGVRYTFRAKFVLLSFVLILGAVVFLTMGDDLIGHFLHETDGIGDAGATLREGHSYMMIMIVGLIPFMITQAYANTLRDIGQTVAPMVSGVIAVFVNLFLNWVLIFGHLGAPVLGVRGAAIATVISRFVETTVIVCYTHIRRDKNAFIVGAYRSVKIPKALMMQIIRKGTPLAINEGLWALGMTLLNQNYSLRGLAVVGALSISSTISNLFSVVYLAMGDSIAIIVGQLLGAGKMEEAKDTDRKMLFSSVVLCLIIGSLMLGFRNLFPQLYNTEPEVKELAAFFILVLSVMMPFHAFLHGSYFTLRTGGKTIITFIFDSVFMWVLVVPCAYLIAHFTDWNIYLMYCLVSALDFIKCIIGFVLVKKGVWVQNIVKNME